MIDIAHLQSWTGRTEESRDTITAGHTARMAALLDRPAPALGDPLPPLWHWTFFAPQVPQSQLGPDGHPRLGGFLPPVPLPRRMWAGGKLQFHNPIHVGEEVTRTSEILSVAEKSGRQGALVFVSVGHKLATQSGLAIEERQDIVYREPSTTKLPAPVAEVAPADWRDPMLPDPVLLFRFSALTFNAHRIHYDLPYATAEEGYPDLVVQGPLTATLLMDAYTRRSGNLPKSFSFRGQAPLFSGGRMAICGRATDQGHDLWAEGPGGYTGMSAQVTA
ncbi:MAG: acyl-CoA dehydrogenase [Paracoccus sp. BP8]|uniref:FAS1-like dehydratase domain-containing protein n=1 Tax=Paracoccus sp. J39 TaxID=935848 RepID=UPI0004B41219|nr:MaoC family dehydratase N-terminal domain-containing protein [Paracoccus sp. J39]RQP04105.1 MAG: acyl-CoA dehydrogenase [Paracoccus sp. BP8]